MTDITIGLVLLQSYKSSKHTNTSSSSSDPEYLKSTEQVLNIMHDKLSCVFTVINTRYALYTHFIYTTDRKTKK